MIYNYSLTYYKRKITVYTVKKFRHLRNKIWYGSWFEQWYEYFKDNGFLYGMKHLLFPPMSEEKFARKVIDYELRNYPGIDYNYVMNLPKLYPHHRRRRIQREKDPWDDNIDYYFNEISNLLKLYNGEKLQEWQEGWYRRYAFNTEKEYLKWKKYFYKVYPKTKEWDVSEEEISQAFSWFDLSYGLIHNYEE